MASHQHTAHHLYNLQRTGCSQLAAHKLPPICSTWAALNTQHTGCSQHAVHGLLSTRSTRAALNTQRTSCSQHAAHRLLSTCSAWAALHMQHTGCSQPAAHQLHPTYSAWAGLNIQRQAAHNLQRTGCTQTFSIRLLVVHSTHLHSTCNGWTALTPSHELTSTFSTQAATCTQHMLPQHAATNRPNMGYPKEP